jgi:Big-like domain-containing protein
MNLWKSATARIAFALLPALLAAAAQPLAAQDDFFTITPCRAYDSRVSGGPLSGGSSRFIKIVGVCGVPVGATAVSVNVTVTESTGGGSLFVGRGDANLPPEAAISISFPPDKTRANNGIVELSTDGSPGGTDVGILVLAETSPGTSVQVIVDVDGYFGNGPAVANPDAATVLEDSGATIINVLANDTDPENDPFSVTAVQNPSANGGTVTNNGGASVSYTPAANYCNDPPGSAPDTFTYTITGGDTDTVSVTVTCVNDAPSFTSGGNVTVSESSGAYSAAWATAISAGPPDESGQTLTFVIVGNSNPGLFSVAPAIDATTGNLSFTPMAATTGSATITVHLMDNGGTANGGQDTSSPDVTFTIDVTGINDAPSFTPGGNVTVNEDSGAYSAAWAWATAISAGPNESQTLTFVIVNNSNPGLFSVAPAIDATTGNLSFTPTAMTAGSATITVHLMDNGGTVNGGQDTSSPDVTFTIDVTGINDAPSFTPGGNVTVNEDSGAYSAAWATAISAGPPDEAGQTLTFVIVNNSNPGLFSVGPAISGTTGNLSFTPAPNAFGSATIVVHLMDNGGTANGGQDTSSPDVSFTIDVTAVNDAPSFTSGGNVTVNEDSGAYSAAWATAISAGPNESQTLTFVIVNNSNPGLFSVAPAIDATTGNLSFTPTANTAGSATITVHLMDNGGTAGGGQDTSSPDVTFTIDVTGINDPPSFTPGGNVMVNEDSGPYSAAWATSISAGPNESQTLTFVIVSNSNPGLFSAAPAISGTTGNLSFTSAPDAFGSATIMVHLMDNGGTANGGMDTSSPDVSFTIDVAPVNDAPSFADPTPNFSAVGNTQLRAGGPASPPAAVAFFTEPDSVFVRGGAITDPDGPGPFQIVAASGPTTKGGTFSIAANGSFTYHPPVGFTADTDTFVVQLTDNGTPAATSNVTVTIAVSERVWYVKNNTSTAGTAGTSVDPFDMLSEAESASGVNDYIYVFKGDGTTNKLNAGITLKAGQRLRGEGVDLVVSGHTLVTGNSANKPLLDHPNGDTVKITQAIPVEIVGLSLAGGTIAGGGSCGSPTFACNAIDLTSAAALSGSGTLTIDSNEFRGAGAEGIDINLNASTTGTLTLNVTNNSWNAAGTHTGNAVDINRAAGTLKLNFSSNANIVSSATAVNIAGGSAASTTITGFADNSVHQNTVGSGIVVANATFDLTPTVGYQQVSGGATTIGTPGDGVGGAGIVMSGVAGDLAFNSLNIFTSGGAGLQVTGTGAVNVVAGTGMQVTVGSGMGNIDATGGPALDLTSMTIDVQNSTLKSANSATTGVNLQVVGGTLTAGNTSAISNATGTDFNVFQSNATVTYDGTITDSTGNSTNHLVLVDSCVSGTKTFNGAISDTGSGTGGGVWMTNNPGVIVNYTGQLTLATGGTNAFVATGGGTISSSNTASTIVTTTGTALNVTSTTIGAAGLKFKSISAGTPGTGPANGIILNTTGSTAGLTVLGTGSAGSGGTIQKTTGDGISLTSTRDVVLKSMNIGDATATDTQAADTTNNIGGNGITINNVQPASNSFGLLLDNVKIARTGGHGINGTGGNVGLSLNNISILNAGDSTGEDAISMGSGFPTTDMLTGTVSITNSTFAAMVDHGFQVENAGAGVLNMTVDTVTFKNNDTLAICGGTCEGSAIQIITDGSSSPSTPTANLTVKRLTATNIDQDVLDLIADPGGVINVTVGDPLDNSVNGITANCPNGDNVLRFNSGSPDADDDASFHFDVRNVVVTQMRGTLVQFKTANTMTGSFINSTLDANDLGNTLAARGIEVTADGDSSEVPSMTILINNVTLNRIGGDGIQVFLTDVTSAASRMDVTIKNCNIGTNPLNTSQTGLEIGRGNASANEGIEVRNFASPGQLYINIDNNNIRNFTSANASAQAIDIDSESNGSVFATVKRNDVFAAPGATDYTIDNESATSSLCADFGTDDGPDGANTGVDATLTQVAGTFNVEGGAGAVAGNNPAMSVTTSGSFGTAVCTMPNLP